LEETTMKKILLGIAAVFALSTFAAPAFADDKPAEGEKKEAKKGGKKKEKKEEKKEEAK
jgi:ribosomal protein L12E/L44/L45/RPP1/RPP2